MNHIFPPITSIALTIEEIFPFLNLLGCIRQIEGMHAVGWQITFSVIGTSRSLEVNGDWGIKGKDLDFPSSGSASVVDISRLNSTAGVCWSYCTFIEKGLPWSTGTIEFGLIRKSQGIVVLKSLF